MKRFLAWAAAVLAALTLVAVLAFRLSPWPSVAVITHMFAKSDDASEEALAKYVPAGITTRRDVPYGGGRDEVLDINHQRSLTTPRPAIVWIHGGGFIAGSKSGIANYLKVIAGHGFTTIAVEYSTGYGTRYPKPVEQINAALAFIVRNAAEFNVDSNRLVLAGDSAGAHIAGQVALIATNPVYANAIGIAPRIGPTQVSAMLLLSGAYDPTRVNFDGDFGWFLKTVLWAYTGVKNFQEDERFDLTSVTKHVTEAFPPSFISSGNGDPLVLQAIALAERLRQLGVRTDTLFFPPEREPRLPHEYQFNLDTDAGREALTRMLAFLATA